MLICWQVSHTRHAEDFWSTSNHLITTSVLIVQEGGKTTDICSGRFKWRSAQRTSGIAGAEWLLDSAATGANEQSLFYVNRGRRANRGCVKQTGQHQPV